jgi:ribosomal-protein-alanine N-acetyltransferase
VPSGVLNALLTTRRLRLEPLAPGHADEIAVLYLDERLWTYFPTLRPADAQALRARFARWSAGPRGDVAGRERWGNWVGFLHETRTAVGAFQATLPADEPAALAYTVFEPLQRQGYALEAMQAIVAHLRATCAITRIAAEMDARNAASIAVARRLGMREVGRLAVDDDRTGARGTELRFEGEGEGEGA